MTPASRASPGRSGGPTSASGSGARCAKTTATDGDAWDYFTHDQARSRAYRWGEDGLAGISDDGQRLCFALALWNEHDPILKERALRPDQQRGQPRRGRQGVLLLPRLDADPLLHEVPLQVPAARVPLPRAGREQPRPLARGVRVRAARHRRLRRRPLLRRLRRVRQGRPRGHPDPISVHNRGPEAARLHVLPTLWFRNTWSWTERARQAQPAPGRQGAIRATHAELGEYCTSIATARPELLFTENETNCQRLWGAAQRLALGQGRLPPTTWCTATPSAVNPASTGTKAAARYILDVPRRRLVDRPPAPVRRCRRVDQAVRRRLRRHRCGSAGPRPTSSTSASPRPR